MGGGGERHADERLTTEDNVGCLMARKKQKDICHFPELVNLHSLLFMWMTGKGLIVLVFSGFFCFVFFPLEEEDPRALTAAMVFVREGEKLSCSRTGEASLDHNTDRCRHPLLFLHLAAGCGRGRGGPAVPIVELVQWDTDLFTVLLPL